ncbi:MAG: hypothetical protein QG597_1517, partial [Actinomycetota bacterium]|nr:hypothetical protein [Actinomycetota bacterium]
MAAAESLLSSREDVVWVEGSANWPERNASANWSESGLPAGVDSTLADHSGERTRTLALPGQVVRLA